MGVVGCQDDGDNIPNFAPQQRLMLTLYSLTRVDVGTNVSSRWSPGISLCSWYEYGPVVSTDIWTNRNNVL